MEYKRRISAVVRDLSAASSTHMPTVATTSVLPLVTPPATLARTRLTIAKFRGEVTNWVGTYMEKRREMSCFVKTKYNIYNDRSLDSGVPSTGWTVQEPWKDLHY